MAIERRDHPEWLISNAEPAADYKSIITQTNGPNDSIKIGA
jgi:hypothetical protein